MKNSIQTDGPFHRNLPERGLYGREERKNILVVEDEGLILEWVSLSISLSLKGSQVFKASDGAQALRILESVPVDLIITDLSMPVMNGFELLELVSRYYPRIPVFVMTADPTQVTGDWLAAHGIIDLLEKPFKPKDLTSRISRFFAGTGAPDEGNPARMKKESLRDSRTLMQLTA